MVEELHSSPQGSDPWHGPGQGRRGSPLVTVIGRSGCGKTTFLEKLISELKRRGHRVGTIKHHSHPGFEIDREGKDSWRHAQAGSDHVVIAAPDRIASYRLLDSEMSLDAIADEMGDVDIILVEGYSRAGKPAVEVVREVTGLELISSESERLAVVSDLALSVSCPIFGLDAASEVADRIECEVLCGRKPGSERRVRDT